MGDRMRVLRGVGLGVLAASIVAIPAAAVALSLAPPAPVTVHDGRLLSWADYPGLAGVPAEQVLDAAEAERRWSALSDDLRTELESGWGLPATGGAVAWSAPGGNGYGGTALVTDLDPEPLRTVDVPAAAERRALVTALAAVAERHGVGPLVLLQDEPASDEQAANGGLPEQRWSIWTAHATGAGARLSVTLLDRDGAHPLGEGEHGLLFEFHQAAVLDADRAAFDAAAAPFRGLEPPPATD